MVFNEWICLVHSFGMYSNHLCIWTLCLDLLMLIMLRSLKKGTFFTTFSMHEFWAHFEQQMGRSTFVETSVFMCVGRQRREAAILVEQAVVSQRAMRHAAWGAKKDIQTKIKKIKRSPYKAVTRVVHPKEILPVTPAQRPLSKGGTRKSPGKQNKVQPLPSTPGAKGRTISPAAATSTVLATPTGFKKVRGEVTPKTQPTLASERDPTLWKIGEDYGRLQCFAVRLNSTRGLPQAFISLWEQCYFLASHAPQGISPMFQVTVCTKGSLYPVT